MSEREFADRVDALRKGGENAISELFSITSLNHPVFSDRSAAATLRMRSYGLAALGSSGLPNRALPVVQEILETSHAPQLIAAAAIAVRGMTEPPRRLSNALVFSIYRIWESDEPICFETYLPQWPLERLSTATSAVLDTLISLGANGVDALPELQLMRTTYASRFSPIHLAHINRCLAALENAGQVEASSCCGSSIPSLAPAIGKEVMLDLEGTLIEDHNGGVLRWEEYFVGQPSVLAFFYTSCSNPRKCVRTIQNLGTIRRLLDAKGLGSSTRVAAISYDSSRDTPTVLKQYAASKGVPIGEHMRLLRVLSGFDQVKAALQLGVNYHGGGVSDHHVELYILNSQGAIKKSILKTHADPNVIVSDLLLMIQKGQETSID